MDQSGDFDECLNWKMRYHTTLCQGLEQQWLSEQYTDTKIIVEEKIFSCHRVVLSAMSPFFEVMYQSGMRECSDGVVTLQEVDAEIFETILQFIYTGDDIVDEDNADRLLRAAVMLQIKCLQERCEDFMTDKVDAENCLALWKLATSHQCHYLAKKAWLFVLNNFSEVCHDEGFLLLDCDEVLAIIQDNDLNTPNEELICEVTFRWVKHDLENRRQYFEKLFETLRLPLVQPEYLLEKIERNDLVKASEACKTIVDEAKRFHLLPARRHEFVSSRLMFRNHGEYEEVIICIGGNTHPGVATKDVYCYSLQTMTWSRLASVPYHVGVEFAVCTYGNAIFVSGGSSSLRGMVYYSTTQNKWVNCGRMLIGRRRHSMVAVGDCVYVLGGFDDDADEANDFSTLISVERFGVYTGKWDDDGFMAFPVRSASTAVIQEKIYLFGGIDGEGQKMDAVQCYDTRQRTCTHIRDLPSVAGMSSAVKYNRTIYLIFPNGKVLKTDDGYEMEEAGTITDFNRCGFGAVIHDGKILLLGGIDSDLVYDAFIGFDTADETSRLLEHRLPFPLFGFGCVKCVMNKGMISF
ncbi:hypothetical protein ACJMK2_035289 [Sinanodonta woodiana]|uniref:BTB domain-containing protein n=1 Tax=Sinanodonta woodiana TaxID=1069815 RepID=A0ABD3WWI5_SINWO